MKVKSEAFSVKVVDSHCVLFSHGGWGVGRSHGLVSGVIASSPCDGEDNRVARLSTQQPSSAVCVELVHVLLLREGAGWRVGCSLYLTSNCL